MKIGDSGLLCRFTLKGREQKIELGEKKLRALFGSSTIRLPAGSQNILTGREGECFAHKFNRILGLPIVQRLQDKFIS
jgi:hypothetical protein